MAGAPSHPLPARQLPRLLTLHKSHAVSLQTWQGLRSDGASSSLIIVVYRFLCEGTDLGTAGGNREPTSHNRLHCDAVCLCDDVTAGGERS